MTTTAASEAFLAALRSSAAEPPTAAVAGAPSPTWLWHVASALHEQLPADIADGWAARLHGLLAERPPATGLHAVHVWHADTIVPLLARAVPDEDSAVITALGDLHRATTAGRPADRDTWRTVLGPALLRLYDAAYDRASTYAEAHTSARDYALANDFVPAEADIYGHEYARLSSEANARAFAEAHARVLGDALSRAYVTEGRDGTEERNGTEGREGTDRRDGREGTDGRDVMHGREMTDECAAYADTYPGAQVRAVVRATTTRDDPFPSVRLAEGLLLALEASRP
ncbi:hypothetical protein ACFV0T_18740 [Streptomyces sp. NPDC059582]|uniref:hypothetical protein n=1 Tax=Streptomyces sp. NPDC059582 TaxID=3346875 RepID=UPI0036BF7035